MTPTPDDSIDDIAGRIADGTPVDWQRAASSSGLRADELAGLRAIAQLHASQRDHASRAAAAVADEDPLVDASADASPLELGLADREEIGRGAFGVVFRATDRALGRRVAVKLLDRGDRLTREDEARFLREARLLAALKHENIVQIHAVSERDGKLELQLEFIDGETLRQRVERDGPMAPAEAARVGIELCRALAAIHGRGIVHRDVKPANVMREQGGRIVLLDLGLARPLAGEALDRAHSSPGTPFLMAPELFDSSAAAGAATDLYALGATLYWLASGAYPWNEKSIGALVAAKRAGRSIPLLDRRAHVPRGFVEILERSLAVDPGARFASAGEFEQALRAFLAGDAARTRPALVSRRTLLAAALLIVAAISAFALKQALTPPPLTLDSAFFAVRDGRDVPLRDGDETQEGDRIVLRARTNRAAWIYVFNEDAAGALYTEFPLPDGRKQNPRPAADGGARETLPDEDLAWVVSSGGGGAESFIVIAATERFEPAEELAKKAPAPSAGDAPAAPVTFADLSPGLRGGLRGAGQTAAIDAAALGAADGGFARLDEWIARAEDRRSDDGVVVHALRLRNVSGR